MIHDETGAAVSIGTVIADPLPDGLTAVALSDADAVALTDGSGAWEPTTLTVVPASVEPSAPLTALDIIAQQPPEFGEAVVALLGSSSFTGVYAFTEGLVANAADYDGAVTAHDPQAAAEIINDPLQAAAGLPEGTTIADLFSG
jgi:nitrogen regulatory protein PII-like uncharacterized protein